jgi:CxxC motif-containing protein (DUF1111 family)
MSASWRASGAAFAILFCFVCSIQAGEPVAENKASARATAKTEQVSISAPDGKELFHREWIPNDPRARGGDGLGPVFNESSCVSCHNQGGSGGGGVKNVDLITAFANPIAQMQAQQSIPQVAPAVNQNLPASILGALVESLTERTNASPTPAPAEAPATLPPPNITLAPHNIQIPGLSPPTVSAEAKQALVKQQKKELEKIHPGFLTARSVVLHRFSTNDKYEPWRLQMMGMNRGQFQMNMPAFSTVEAADTVTINADAAVEPQAPIVSGTLTLTSSNVVVTSSAQVAAQPVAAPAPSDFQISVVNESGDADQRIQSLRNVTQLAHAQGMQGQVGNFAFLHSRRNATALFGAGLIDRIPDSVLIEQAKVTYKDFPEIQGRVAKMKGDKIGRYGWKGQKANLYEFSMTACAVELGLDVPDHPQAGMPLDAAYKSKAHDMDQPECDALVAYLRNLPAPVKLKPASAEEAKFVSAGEKQFAAVGCANCHTAKLGEVAGIYSDLLLHDMGQDLGDTGSYGVFVPNTPEEDDSEPVPSLNQQFLQANNGRPQSAAEAQAAREKTIGALRQEWRTPPLWGVRDSAPYLHDGRANTLDEAIALHGGEAANSAKKFFMLKPEERLQVTAFMKTLTAPEQTASAE